MTKTTGGRISSSHTVMEAAMLLVEDSYASIKMIGPLLQNLGEEAGSFLLLMDEKRLYVHRIAVLFSLCGEDIERFKYHVFVELPQQETGAVLVAGPYFRNLDPNSESGRVFAAKRSFWKPGSFWGLENPPKERDYEYPIN